LKRGISAFIRENMKNVKHKVIVFGGKGGVGKSMLAINLASALKKLGKTVCILDQVYDCPAIPLMLGISEDKRLMIGENGMLPVESDHGVKVVSTGLILDPDEVIVWFHDMKKNATEELLAGVDYGDIDYLVVDIPAGTSSETVNALKYIPDVDGGLVITVPSEVSQNVAKRCIYIMRKAKVPVLGVVENMSGAVCAHCGAPVEILQKGAGERMAESEGIPFLGRIPMSRDISVSLDQGNPFVVGHADSDAAKVMMHIGEKVIEAVEAGG